MLYKNSKDCAEGDRYILTAQSKFLMGSNYFKKFMDSSIKTSESGSLGSRLELLRLAKNKGYVGLCLKIFLDHNQNLYTNDLKSTKNEILHLKKILETSYTKTQFLLNLFPLEDVNGEKSTINSMHELLLYYYVVDLQKFDTIMNNLAIDHYILENFAEIVLYNNWFFEKVNDNITIQIPNILSKIIFYKNILEMSNNELNEHYENLKKMYSKFYHLFKYSNIKKHFKHYLNYFVPTVSGSYNIPQINDNNFMINLVEVGNSNLVRFNSLLDKLNAPYII